MIKTNRLVKHLAIVPVGVLAVAGVFAVDGMGSAFAQPAGDPVRGKSVFARCAACHDLNTGATRLGPSLKGIVGRTSGTMPNFNYSQAMKAKAIEWTAANLDAYLAAPTKVVPGNRMAFPPLANAQDRADLIVFLQQSAR